jgi:hypothetical protein
MHIRLSVLIGLCSLLLAFTHAFAQDTTPPTGTLFHDEFNSANPSWLPSGTWTVSNGLYGNATGSGDNISVIKGYEGVGLHGLGTDKIESPEYRVSARMRNQGTTDEHLVGIVYGYQDSRNYFEVVISALGAVKLRTVMNGVPVDELCCTRLDLPRNTWFSVEVHWKNGQTSVAIDGRVVTGGSQPEFTTGRAGLVTHNAVGRFDKVDVSVPFGDQGFFELFDDSHTVFAPQSGQWISDEIYRNTAVNQTSITLAPPNTGTHEELGDTVTYTFRARMRNPYAGSGNLVGIVFNYESPTRYSEVVFSPTGVAKINRVVSGVATAVATANYGGTRNVAFDVALEWDHGITSVLVNGQRLFTRVLGASPSATPRGSIGLITHWAPGEFDSIEFDHGIFNACSKTFSSSSEAPTAASGTWDVSGGTLNSTAVTQTDISAFFQDCKGNDVGQDIGADFVFGASLLNEFGASGNLIGLVYDYQDSSNYYEVVFASTGSVQINKVFQGVRTTVATATHSVPRNTWFNVQVGRTSVQTDVRINGVTVIPNLVQLELLGGSIGFVTHWTRGHFDNVTLTDRPNRPPTEL